MKRYLNNDPHAFEAEVSNLKRLNKEDNTNLIKLLGTYSYQDQQYLLFPWADGNLLDFWKAHPDPSQSEKLDHSWVLWFSKQCLGIAQGLKGIHSIENVASNSAYGSTDQLHGRHGDLKPENILWFRNPANKDGHPLDCALKISDFGLTDFHRNRSKSGINARSVGNSPTYRAPEYDVTWKVSQNYDIWTLGCVLLEFATWFLLGWSKVNQFSDNRLNEDNPEISEMMADTFFVLVSLHEKNGPPGARLKESVARVSLTDLSE